MFMCVSAYEVRRGNPVPGAGLTGGRDWPTMADCVLYTVLITELWLQPWESIFFLEFDLTQPVLML